jgi:hypothetical protein
MCFGVVGFGVVGMVGCLEARTKGFDDQIFDYIIFDEMIKSSFCHSEIKKFDKVTYPQLMLLRL